MNTIYTIIVFLLIAVNAHAYTIVGTVTKVIDGDTFMTTHHKKTITVDVADIDCPELQQPGGAKAKQVTSDFVLGKLVEIRTDRNCQSARISGNIITNKGRSLRIALIQKGLAWPAPKTKNDLVLNQYKKARNSKIGIWASNNSIPPWKWRQHINSSKSKRKLRSSMTRLYGDSAVDIARDSDGTAVGAGGGLTIAPKSKNKIQINEINTQALHRPSPPKAKKRRQKSARKKIISADDYTIKLSARQSGDYVKFSGRISNGPTCKKLRVSAYADSNQGGTAHAIKIVSFSSGVRSKTFDGKDRYPWYKKSSPKPQWEVTSVYATCVE